MNQRNNHGKILSPISKIPVALISDFLADDVLLPLVNLEGNGFGTFFQLLVGRGSHSTVSYCAITKSQIVESQICRNYTSNCNFNELK